MWSTRFLAKACAVGTFGMVGVVIFAHEEIQGRIRKSQCYIEAFQHLHENKGAVKYFGEPIKAGYANNIYDTADQSDSVYWYKVPIKGPDGKGALYYKTVKEKHWYLQRVELELEKLPSKKFLIMEKNGSENRTENEVENEMENKIENEIESEMENEMVYETTEQI